MSKRVEVSRTIKAPAELLYDMLSDLPRMGEWSPENRGGRWVNGATGPAVGARFKGRNRKGWARWSTDVTVVTAVPGQEFAFDVKVGPVEVARWGYRLEPSGKSTIVTEYWEDHRNPFAAKVTGLLLGVPDRAMHNRKGMELTLERLAAAADSAS
jgi:uncharacterized protein YndB with AHSA1/START domain